MSRSRARAPKPVVPPTPAPAARPQPPVAPSAIATLALPVLLTACLGLAVLGFGVGLADAFVHARTVDAGVDLPIGLPIAVAALGGVVLSAGMLTRSRIGAGVVGLGWVISVLVFTSPRAEGDVIIAATATGYAYLFGGVLVLSALIALPYGSLGAGTPNRPDTA